MCPKPIGKELWDFNEVKDRWDSLILRAHITRNGNRMLYQEGVVARMLSPESLIAHISVDSITLPIGTAMYCGTMPLLQSMGPADLFEIELEDPTRGRKLKHSYTTRTLPYSD
jgi:hypothetical protein